MSRKLWVCLILLVAVGPAVGQPTVPPGAAGYYGSGVTQPFNEKALFPPNGAAPASPPPREPPPTLVPDGSLPPPPPPKLWTGGFEFGVNGSQGNSDVLNVRVGLNADRRTDTNLYHADLLYTLTRQDGTTNQNQAWLNARDEILFPNSPWSVFAATQVEYNEFREYNLRVGAYTGVAYQWLRTETTMLKTRIGAGAAWQTDTRSFGPPDQWVPEAILGADFNRKLTDRQAFISTVDIYPNLSQIGQYRLRARIGYEVLIDPDHGLVLRLGVQDWYDTNPGSAARNDVNYFATLMFKF